MLKTYSVTVSRLIKEQATFTLESESKEELRELVTKVILHPANETEYELHWEPVETLPIWITLVEEQV